MGACLACCALDAGCSILGSFMPGAKAAGGRIVSSVMFIIYSFVMMAVWRWPGWMGWIRSGLEENVNCDDSCVAFYATYKLMLALIAYHALMAAVLVGVNEKSNARAFIQEALWPFKFVLLIGLSLLSLWKFPIWAIDYLYWPVVLISLLFILVQTILLIDLSYGWSDAIMSKIESAQDDTESGASLWKATIIAITFGCLGTTVLIPIIVWIDFTSMMAKFLVGISSVLVIIMCALSMLPSIQEANASAGLFQASILSLFSMFLMLGALMTNALLVVDAKVVGGTNPPASNTVPLTESFPFLSRFFTVLSIIYALLSIIQLAINTVPGSQLIGMTSSEGSASKLDDDDEAMGRYNYSFFHLMLLSAAAFTCMYITFWRQPLQVIENGLKRIVLVDGVTTFWARTFVSFIVGALYLWSLCAPLIFKDREF